MNPKNLTPMEIALLESVQKSNEAHERRLTALESLLNQLGAQSRTESMSDRKTHEDLLRQLGQLSKQLAELEARLSTWEPSLAALSEANQITQDRAQQMTETYTAAVQAFNLMQGQYRALALEVGHLRELAG